LLMPNKFGWLYSFIAYCLVYVYKHRHHSICNLRFGRWKSLSICKCCTLVCIIARVVNTFLGLNLPFKDKKVRSFSVFPDFRNSTDFWKFPRLRPFIVLMRAIYRWRWVWSFGGMIMTRKNRLENNLPQWNFLHLKYHVDWQGIKPGLPQ
jgi:hypothetical protein